MSKRVKVYTFLVIAAALGGGYYLNQKHHFIGGVAKAKGNEKAGDAEKGKKEASPVELALATTGEISSFITSTGNLRAVRDIVVATQAEGFVKTVTAEEGDYVTEGQLLCALDDTQLRIRLELAKEKLAQASLQKDKAGIRQEKATAQTGHTKAELARYQKAHHEGLVSEKEVATYKYKLEELEHDARVSSSETKEFSHRVAELEAEISQAHLEISRTQIKAPFAGYITQRTVNTGQRVRPLDPLFNLGSFSPLYADVFLSEREAQQVHPNQTTVVRLGIEDSGQTAGKVIRISPVVDQGTGTVKVTVELNPGKGGFRPGAFVRVDIRTNTHATAVLIPKRAVIEEDGQSFVYVANGEVVKRAKVGLGFETEGRVEVKEGVTAGQKVVVAGQGALKEGSKIRVIQG